MDVSPILWALTRALERYPHLRVGQLIANAVPVGRDLFYVEDEDLMTYIEAFSLGGQGEDN